MKSSAIDIEYENLKKSNAPFQAEYEKVCRHVFESGWYILGRNVSALEQEFAAYLSSDNCVGVASGLDALTIALVALELPENSEVLVSSNTYIASILAVIHAGLKPVLVEPRLETYNIDPHLIERSITKKTAAVLVTHLYGKPCEMDAIHEICKQHSLKLVEDCAQSHGASFQGKMTGTFGHFGCFSFYPTKNLGALGDGGALTSDFCDLAQRARVLRNYGSSKKYQNEVVGYNSRLDELQAAFLRVKLKHLKQITEHKRKLATIYNRNLGEQFVKPLVSDSSFDVYHIYAIRHPKRDELRNYLLERGIQTEIHYPIAPHKQKALRGLVGDSYPISEEIHATILSLPISYFHTESDIYRVCEVMNQFA